MKTSIKYNLIITAIVISALALGNTASMLIMNKISLTCWFYNVCMVSMLVAYFYQKYSKNDKKGK